MEPNLTVLTLRNSFIPLLHHVTAVIIVKTRLPVTRNYKITKRCLLEELHLELCLNLHRATF